jgi:phosphoribosyl-dephospho-CoA transferase
LSSRKINLSIPRSNILTTTTSNIRVPNPLRQLQLLMVTKEKNIKIRRLADIETFVIKMVMMSPNVSRRWQL